MKKWSFIGMGILAILISSILGFKSGLVVEGFGELPFLQGDDFSLQTDDDNIYFYTKGAHTITPQIFVYNIEKKALIRSLSKPLGGMELLCSHQNRAIYSDSEGYLEIEFKEGEVVTSKKMPLPERGFYLDCFPIEEKPVSVCKNRVFLSVPLLRNDGILTICDVNATTESVAFIAKNDGSSFRLKQIDPLLLLGRNVAHSLSFGVHYIPKEDRYFLFHNKFFDTFSIVVDASVQIIFAHKFGSLSLAEESAGFGAGIQPVSFFIGRRKIAAYTTRKLKILLDAQLQDTVSKLKGPPAISSDGRWLYFVDETKQGYPQLNRTSME